MCLWHGYMSDREKHLSELRQCRRCSRLDQYLQQLRVQYPDYYNAPVPSVGDAGSRLLVVGLAPGLHGGNRTAVPFFGDGSGTVLFQALQQSGFIASDFICDDDRQDLASALIDCRITNAVRCLPPQNRPRALEIRHCQSYLSDELECLPSAAAVLSLGTVAHEAVIQAAGFNKKQMPFAHGAQHNLGAGCRLFNSYHCSRYNLQTGRLTPSMLQQVLQAITYYFGN